MKLLTSISKTIRRAIHSEGQVMFFRQSLLWSRAIMWTIIGVATGLLLWACLAHMEEVVHATGKLEPHGSVQDVQSPVAGVISAILVEEGARVKAGQPLIKLDPKVATAELRSLREMLASMKNEESFYAQLFDIGNPGNPPVGLPPGLDDLAKNRVTLQAENKLLRAQIAFSSQGVALDPDQSKLFEEAEKDRTEKLTQAQLKAERAEKDLASATGQLAQGRLLLANSQKILESYKKLLDSGGVSKVEFLAHEADAIQAETQVQRLENLSLSLSLEISRAREEATNTNTAYRKDAMSRLSENMKKMAEIESGLTKARLANSQRILEIESRLAESSASLEHHEITSPSDGIVFEIVASKPGTVLAPKDIVLKIVPSEELIAKVDITNRDIGFIRTGLACDIEIASFPAREYGKIDGTLTFVGSDVLPPTQEKPNYSFPAKIDLARQSLDVRAVSVPLQSGMAVSANIKVRNRRVISLFVDFLLGPLDKMKEVR
ncbi:MAG: HlyD family efflux transporter periplasmic adaptor subunit [Terrimicrobiaceae bacterium]